jgi:hypothetical protein
VQGASGMGARLAPGPLPALPPCRAPGRRCALPAPRRAAASPVRPGPGSTATEAPGRPAARWRPAHLQHALGQRHLFFVEVVQESLDHVAHVLEGEWHGGGGAGPGPRITRELSGSRPPARPAGLPPAVHGCTPCRAATCSGPSPRPPPCPRAPGPRTSQPRSEGAASPGGSPPFSKSSSPLLTTTGADRMRAAASSRSASPTVLLCCGRRAARGAGRDAGVWGLVGGGAL